VSDSTLAGICKYSACMLLLWLRPHLLQVFFTATFQLHLGPIEMPLISFCDVL
jgi:hypothetical protein